MAIIGIDPSLTSTGLAVKQDDGTIITDHVPTSGHRDDCISERWIRLESIVTRVDEMAAAHGCDTAVIEHPIDIRGGSKIDRFGLFWLIVDRLMTHQVVVHTVSPSARAKAATGRGNASKTDVIAAMRARYPSVLVRNDDEADAMALLVWLENQ